MVEILSSGGGTQSTAIVALIVQGRLPKPDMVVIADTGREMPTTWKYLDEVTIPALKSVGVEIHRIGQDYCSPADRDIFHASGTLMIPVFSRQSGDVGKLSSFCSDKWKARVVNRWLKQKHGLRRIDYRKWIGFSMDETRRVNRMMGGEEYKTGLLRLPLVHDVPLRRDDSINVVMEMGWPKPPRSRCWMCPNQSDYEWNEVKEEYPEYWNQAVDLDESLRRRDPNAFLHSSAAPLKDADLSEEDDLFSASCPSGECFL